MAGRREKRKTAKLQVLVTNQERPWLREEVSTENINSYGMRVQVGRAWEPGTIVLVKSSEGDLLSRARVVYCKRLRNEFGLGLEFLARPLANFAN